MTNFNELTNSLLYKNIISHTLFSKGWCCCMREISWRQGRTAKLTPNSSSTTWVFFSHIGSVAQLWVTEDPKPSVCRCLSFRHLVSNWLEPSGTWLYYCLTSSCFRCSSTYLHRSISWLTARSRVNIYTYIYIYIYTNTKSDGWM